MRPPLVRHHHQPQRAWLPPPGIAWRQTATLVTTPAIIAPMMLRRAETGMCPEQEADYRAACNGSLTWAQYLRKWGGGGLSR
jgi:hypothetical protein